MNVIKIIKFKLFLTFISLSKLLGLKNQYLLNLFIVSLIESASKEMILLYHELKVLKRHGKGGWL